MNRLKIMIILLFGLSFGLPSFSYADTVSTGVGISFAGTTQPSNDVPSEDNDRNPGISDPISKSEGTLPQTGELVHSLAVVLIGLLFMMLSVLILIKYREDKEEV